MIFLMLALFAANTVLAAPAGLAMQLAEAGSLDTPCHMHDQDGPSHDQTPQHGPGSQLHAGCHGCLACLPLLCEGIAPLHSPEARSPRVPFVMVIYLPRVVPPAARPPIQS